MSLRSKRRGRVFSDEEASSLILDRKPKYNRGQRHGFSLRTDDGAQSDSRWWTSCDVLAMLYAVAQLHYHAHIESLGHFVHQYLIFQFVRFFSDKLKAGWFYIARLLQQVVYDGVLQPNNFLLYSKWYLRFDVPCLEYPMVWNPGERRARSGQQFLASYSRMAFPPINIW